MTITPGDFGVRVVDTPNDDDDDDDDSDLFFTKKFHGGFIAQEYHTM